MSAQSPAKVRERQQDETDAHRIGLRSQTRDVADSLGELSLDLSSFAP